MNILNLSYCNNTKSFFQIICVGIFRHPNPSTSVKNYDVSSKRIQINLFKISYDSIE